MGRQWRASGTCDFFVFFVPSLSNSTTWEWIREKSMMAAEILGISGTQLHTELHAKIQGCLCSFQMLMARAWATILVFIWYCACSQVAFIGSVLLKGVWMYRIFILTCKTSCKLFPLYGLTETGKKLDVHRGNMSALPF